MDSSMKKLSINAPSQDEKLVAESWDDEVNNGSEEESNTKTPERSSHSSKPSESYPSAPPPTPMSPQFVNPPPFGASSSGSPIFEGSLSSRDTSAEQRPEKTTQTASRMIAAGLGVKAPKRTEEQKQYDKATKENEARRISQRKEERRKQEEEREKAKTAIWDS